MIPRLEMIPRYIVPQTIPGTEMISSPQMKEMSGLRNLDSEFISSIFLEIINSQFKCNMLYR